MSEPYAGRLIGQRWRLQKRLSQSDRSAVYLATSPDSQTVAVKLLVPAVLAAEETLCRLKHDNWAPDRVKHPRVPRILAHSLWDPDQPYLVSELLEGETLAQRMERGPPVSEPQLLSMAECIADILADLHSQGITHGELTAEHVFLCEDGEVRLLGMDLPSPLRPLHDGSVSEAVRAPGPLAELAPEQASGQWDGLDGRADLFGLGALLFVALAGRRVHEAAEPALRADLMRTTAASPLASIAPTLPVSLCVVVDTALAFSVGARYPDAATLRLDLRAVRNGLAPPFATARLHETILASPPQRLSERARESIRARVRDSAAPPSSNADALVGTLLAGRFRIDKHLGSGGMGSVYQAQHIHIRKAVAIKVLHREMSCMPEVVARFEREAIAAARIEHPNVAAASDFGRIEDGSFYLVLEYVQGESLRAVLTRLGPQPTLRSLAIARQIALALGAAHAAGVVHRDLKPENVMLEAGREGRDHVKVLDFGIAKVNAEELGEPALTRVGMVFGTPEYMSPEQAAGQPVDLRTDLYALGILLYEMLSGSTPFSSDSLVAVLGAQITASPPELPTSIPVAVRQIISRLLSKSPDERFQSAADLVVAIDSATDAQACEPKAADSGVHALRRALDPALGLGSRAMTRALRAVRSLGLALATRRVQWLGRSLPLAWLVAAGPAVTILGAAILWPAGEPRLSGSERSASVFAATEPSSDALLARAEGGDPSALAELRGSKNRGPREWRALGNGYAHVRDWASSIEAYTHLLELDPASASDPKLVPVVYHALREPNSSRAALELAEKSLGSIGADLLYDVASEMRSSRGAFEKALGLDARKRLDAPGVRSHASRALRVALDLGEARACRDFQQLTASAIAYGDMRSLPALRRANHRSGCGFLRLSDCYACLRRDGRFTEAVEAASHRPSPKFTTGPEPVR